MVNDQRGAYFELIGLDGCIRVSIGSGGWSECWLNVGQRQYLGSENIGNLADKLLVGIIKNQGIPAGEIDRLPVKWVLTMPITYIRIYSANHRDQRLLFFQDLQGKTIAKIHVGKSQLDEWQKILEAQPNFLSSE